MEYTNGKRGILKWLVDYYLLREELDEIIGRKIECVNSQKFEFAASFREKEKKLRRKYKSLCAKIEANL